MSIKVKKRVYVKPHHRRTKAEIQKQEQERQAQIAGRMTLPDAEPVYDLVVRELGNSYVITLPREIAGLMQAEPGDTVLLGWQQSDEQVVIRKVISSNRQ